MHHPGTVRAPFVRCPCTIRTSSVHRPEWTCTDPPTARIRAFHYARFNTKGIQLNLHNFSSKPVVQIVRSQSVGAKTPKPFLSIKSGDRETVCHSTGSRCSQHITLHSAFAPYFFHFCFPSPLAYGDSIPQLMFYCIDFEVCTNCSKWKYDRQQQALGNSPKGSAQLKIDNHQRRTPIRFHDYDDLRGLFLTLMNQTKV